jgi:hypothetical protein
MPPWVKGCHLGPVMNLKTVPPTEIRLLLSR